MPWARANGNFRNAPFFSFSPRLFLICERKKNPRRNRITFLLACNSQGNVFLYVMKCSSLHKEKIINPQKRRRIFRFKHERVKERRKEKKERIDVCRNGKWVQFKPGLRAAGWNNGSECVNPVHTKKNAFRTSTTHSQVFRRLSHVGDKWGLSGKRPASDVKVGENARQRFYWMLLKGKTRQTGKAQKKGAKRLCCASAAFTLILTELHCVDEIPENDS